jgi:hypothetical protein
MFGSRILEVAIGIVFIFLVVSIICSAIREVIESWRKSRAAYLEHGIRELLHDPGGVGLARALYEHPLISGLYGGNYIEGKIRLRPSILAKGGELPSYIPTRNFALALLDMAARGTRTDAVSGDPEAPPLTLEMARRNVAGLDSPTVQRVVLAAIDSSQGDFDTARAALEKWYDSAMDRVSGWYKRSTGWVIFWIGLAVALALNVNTITIADYLYRNDPARQALVVQAQQMAGDTANLRLTAQEAKAMLDAANLPIGWAKGWGAPTPRTERRSTEIWFDIVAPMLGLLLTAVAATFGAPFWFDLLNKMMVVRSTVKPAEKSGEEGSEDRAKPKGKSAEPSGDGAPGEAGAAPPPRTPMQQLLSASAKAPSPRDEHSSEDGCDVEMAGVGTVTRDEDLPEAEGGVASS